MGRRSCLAFDALTIDRNSKVRLQRQLYEALRRYILEGRIGAGKMLPATRILAQHLGVGRNTVIAAYDQLFAEGYVEARSGSGTRVASLLHLASEAPTSQGSVKSPGLSRRGTQMQSSPAPKRTPGTLNVHPGFPERETFPFSAWGRLLARNARRRTEDMLMYDSFAGHRGLREAIAEYLGVARGVTCKAEQVIVVTGAQAALDLITRLLLDEGDRAWLEEPGYIGARNAFLAGGGKLAALRVDRNGWQLNDPHLPVPRIIYVTPSCQWPLGTVMRLDERLQLLSIAERHKAWIIEDDYDGEFRFRGQPVPALCGLDHSQRVIYVGTFGKTLFSSLRIGFLVAPPALAPAFERALSVTGQFAPLLMQATLGDFLREGYFAAHLKRMRRLYLRRQAEFIAICRDELGEWIDVQENDAGMQILGWLRGPLDDREITTAALRHGIDVQPVSINYREEPRHGLLLGYAGLGERDIGKAVAGLRRVFEEAAARASGRGKAERVVPPNRDHLALLRARSRS